MSVIEHDQFPALADMARFVGKVQHVGQVDFQEEEPFPQTEWDRAERWCVEKSREPHVRFVALACGGTFQRSWRDGVLVWDIRRNSSIDHCPHKNEHGDNPEEE